MRLIALIVSTNLLAVGVAGLAKVELWRTNLGFVIVRVAS